MKLSEVSAEPESLSSGFISVSHNRWFEFNQAALFGSINKASEFAKKFNDVSHNMYGAAIVSSTLNGVHLVLIVDVLGIIEVDLEEAIIAYGMTYDLCLRNTKRILEKNPEAAKARGVESIDDVVIIDVEFSDPADILSQLQQFKQGDRAE